jgi:hypothetical protein
MRRGIVSTVACAAMLAGCVVALVLPMHTPLGENCGSAYFAAPPPANDDSWFSTCANLRETRRGDFTLPAVLAGLSLFVSGGLLVRRYRDCRLGFELPEGAMRRASSSDGGR